MNKGWVLALLLLTTPSAAADEARSKADALAAFQWKLNCQGCHQADGSGSAGGAPDMRGIVTDFLTVPGGREYLGRVPGVAFAPIKDDELAYLLNWLLVEYGHENHTTNFQPYTGKEIGKLRQDPLIDDAAAVRNGLVAILKNINRKME